MSSSAGRTFIPSLHPPMKMFNIVIELNLNICLSCVHLYIWMNQLPRSWKMVAQRETCGDTNDFAIQSRQMVHYVELDRNGRAGLRRWVAMSI